MEISTVRGGAWVTFGAVQVRHEYMSPRTVTVYPDGRLKLQGDWEIRASSALPAVRRSEPGEPPGLYVDRAGDPFAQPVPAGASAVRSALPSFGPVFTAGYTSECPGCCGDVEPGSDARMLDGDAWHEECAQADLSGWSYGPDGWEP